MSRTQRSIRQFSLLLFLLAVGSAGATSIKPLAPAAGTYTLVVEGYDWGPAASKVILNYGKDITEIDLRNFAVYASRKSSCAPLTPDQAFGSRDVIYAYVSDQEGNRIPSGTYATLVLEVGPTLPLSAPMQYFGSGDCQGSNHWVDYHLKIIEQHTNKIWTEESSRIMPLADEFDLSGKYTTQDGITMSYASYAPSTAASKAPLLIWLHGGGEGGSDPTIPLMANRAANYVSPDIQQYFGGAHVLVPQCPGAWMHNTEGVSTRGRDEDIYHLGLMSLIQNFVAEHPGIDENRIYVGGCSNGGYMSLKLILDHPDYFAAGFISALAYQSQYISDEQVQSIKDVPMWFIHSADDPVTLAKNTATPVYERLLQAGAKHVHFSYFDHVIDITGIYGGPNFHYLGHFSWIYSHTNKCTLDYDSKPVLLDGKPTSLMQWMASQSN